MYKLKNMKKGLKVQTVYGLKELDTSNLYHIRLWRKMLRTFQWETKVLGKVRLGELCSVQTLVVVLHSQP